MQNPQITGTQSYHTVADTNSLGQFLKSDLRIIFADQVPKSEVKAILDSVHGHIVDGPNALGVYTIRIADSEYSDGTLSQSLENLRKHQSVVFAEPALPSIPNQ